MELNTCLPAHLLLPPSQMLLAALEGINERVSTKRKRSQPVAAGGRSECRHQGSRQWLRSRSGSHQLLQPPTWLARAESLLALSWGTLTSIIQLMLILTTTLSGRSHGFRLWMGKQGHLN